MGRSRPAPAAAGFTLVELIVVMALLAVVAAIAMPSLGRSMRERNLRDESMRLLAATEYARSEAIGQGVPMSVWIDPGTGRFGVHAKPGYEGDTAREKEFALNADVNISADASSSRGREIEVASFSPNGTPASGNLDQVKLTDRFGGALALERTNDGWGYEVRTAAR